ncbi:5-formyltetrahydrofolate cyclo-ligase [Paraglaciecola sp. L3A3]|uniref:5-formyltetrahydrofolate cyclo-ligase n=1 Tax=Paraglaciecola sp. L3A3 TaxID=2686358 RepID=UPI00131ABD00|nr:5-formyltetrahydrofolate cyclo-ligase [Paraglaciecola sp. L3A3]
MINSIPKNHRQELRQFYRQQRKQLTAEKQQSAAQMCLQVFLQNIDLTHIKTVAYYLANDGELDPQAMIQFCWQHNIQVLLPVLDPKRKGHLVFVNYQASSPMQTNIYGIAEPIASEQNIVELADIDLIFTPLVAFDIKGNRLGMGGGYYDRTLAPIRQKQLKTQLIGLAHDCQKSEKLPIDGWDIPLNAITTPTQFFKIA